jgi:hypothetical protein
MRAVPAGGHGGQRIHISVHNSDVGWKVSWPLHPPPPKKPLTTYAGPQIPSLPLIAIWSH